MAFLFFLVGIALVAVVGHGLWLLAGVVWQVVTTLGAGAIEAPVSAALCPCCGSASDLRARPRVCRFCGWAANSRERSNQPRPDLTLAQLRRRVERFGSLGLIAADSHERIVAAIQAEESRLVKVDPARRRVEEVAPSPPTLQSAPTLAPASEPKPVFAGPVAPVGERAEAFRRFQERQLAGVEPVGAIPADKGSRGVFDLLAAFLEERSIRWGELVGGLLIVGCSLALVISFWASIAERPWIKYGLLNGVTALLFVLASRAERRWRLPTTARGLAIIATLLTPLNFLAVASLASGNAVGSSYRWLGEAVAIAIFAPLVYRAGRTLVAGRPWTLLIGVVAPSAAMLLAGRSVDPDRGSDAALILGALPWLAVTLAVGGWLVRFGRDGEIGEARAVELLRLVGLATFAASVALGLVVARAGPIGQVAYGLAPLAPLIGGAILTPGLLLWRRVEAADLVGYRTAGTAIATAGTGILLVGVVLGWPDPARVLPVAALDFVVLTAIAVAFRVPAAHALAGGCLVLAYLFGWALAAGRLAWTGQSADQVATVLLSSAGGAALVPIALAFGVVAAAGSRAGRWLDAQAYALVAGLASLLSLGLVTWHGFGVAGDPVGATWAYATFALACPAFGIWWGRFPLVEGSTGGTEARSLSWLGSGLLLATLVQGIVFAGGSVGGTLPWIMALLAHASITTGLTVTRSGLDRRHWDRLIDGEPDRADLSRSILDRSALGASVTAAVGLILALPIGSPASLAGNGVWLASLWVILAIRWSSPAWFAAAQGAITWGVVFGLGAILERFAWFKHATLAWLDPRTIQAEGVALGLLCLGTMGVRLGVRGVRTRSKRLATIDGLLEPPWPPFDRHVRGALIVLMIALAAYAAIPGSMRELTPRDVALALGGIKHGERIVGPVAAFEIPGIPHVPAIGVGSWFVWGLSLVVLLAGQWERFRRLDLLAALGVALLAAPLAAAWFDAGVAVATAWRWSSALAFLVGSVLLWNRERLGRVTDRLGWRVEQGVHNGLLIKAIGVVFAAGFLPMVGLAVYRGVTAALNRPPAAGVGEAWFWVGFVFLILSTANLALRGSRFDQRSWLRPLLLVLGVLPLVAVSVLIVVQAMAGNPTTGVEPASIFGRIGPLGSLVPPLLIITATLVGWAIRERSARFAFAAGLFAHLTATTGYLFVQPPTALRLDPSLWVRLAQVNAIVASLTALAWMGALVVSRRGARRVEVRSTEALLTTAINLGIVLNGLILLSGTFALWVNPIPASVHPAIAGPVGAVALVLVAGVILARSWLSGERLGVDWLGFGLVCLADWLALGLSYRDRGNWFTYHGVLIGQAMVGLALPLIAWRHGQIHQVKLNTSTRAMVIRWSRVALGIVVLFAIRGYWSDPQSPWWTVGGLVAMGGLAASLAGWADRPRLLWLAAGLVNLAALAWWCAGPRWMATSPGGWTLVDLALIEIIALTLPAPIWGEIERRLPRSSRQNRTPFHRFVAWTGLIGLALLVAVNLANNAGGSTDHALSILGWGAVATIAPALCADLRDQRAFAPLAGLYLLGLVAAGWSVVLLALPPRWLAWAGTLVLAAYSVGTSYLWSRRDALRLMADRLGIPRPDSADLTANLGWLVPANLLLAAGVLILAFRTILTDPMLALRSSSAHAAFAGCLAIGLLARGSRRTQLQFATLDVGILGAVAWGWAWIAPSSATGSLDRAAIVLAATVVGATVYGLGFSKLRRLEDDWTEAARRVVPSLLGLATLAGVVVLLLEGADRLAGRPVALAGPAVAVVAGSLVVAMGAALVAAIVPGRDPLGLSERGRTAYIYAAEVVLALLGAHCKLNFPWLFSGRFIYYWPLMLMAVAFMGVSLSEIFRRQGRAVLAEPLERTGAFLPVLPLLAAFWNVPRPGEDVVYLVLMGVLYAVLASLRSSFGFGALAALAGNGAVWAWLSHQDRLSILAHPQLWVISPALCVLIGGYLNRDRLTQSQRTGIQYAALMAIYLASTADIILTGVTHAPWLPVVLAALAVLGIFAGIAFHVRGFLFLGVGFLSVALFSIIWYAAVDLNQTWLWAASGIVSGILILVFFGLFEKKRHEVLQIVGQLKEWNP